MNLKNFLSKLEHAKQSGNGYTARCPAHDDTHNSLSVSEGDNCVLVHCHANCSTEAIVRALNLTMSDLYYEKSVISAKNNLSKTKKLEAEYIYVNEHGNAIHKVIRYSDKSFSQAKMDKSGKWVYNMKDVTTVLYQLPSIIEAVKNDVPIFIVEGEKDAENLTKLGFTATTNPMGAGKWRPQYNNWLLGANVYIIPDNDNAGYNHLSIVANNLNDIATSVKVIYLNTKMDAFKEHCDITDYLRLFLKRNGVKDKDNARETAINEIHYLMDNAILWSENIDGNSTKNHDIEWDEPIPFNEIELPDFPYQCLPSPLRHFVEALSESTQTPPEMSGLLSLGILSTALQSHYTVEITSDWKEPLCLFTVAIASPGERKSAVFAKLTAPIVEFEHEQHESNKTIIAQNETEKIVLEKALANAQNQASKTANSENRKKVLDLSAELAAFEEKHSYRLLVDDTTPEKLTDIMAQQNGCISIFSAEGGVFEMIAGRYDKNLNLDIYLKGHAGDTISVDRIGRKSNRISNPRLSMLLTVQPQILSGLMNNSTFRGRGLCGRFLYAICNSKVGKRNVNPPPFHLLSRKRIEISSGIFFQNNLQE
jgi:DNA primase (bacterial type)